MESKGRNLKRVRALCVKNVHVSIDELMELFEKYGTVSDIHPLPKDASLAFVRYSTDSEAERAMAAINASNPFGINVNIAHDRKHSGGNGQNRSYSNGMEWEGNNNQNGGNNNQNGGNNNQNGGNNNQNGGHFQRNNNCVYCNQPGRFMCPRCADSYCSEICQHNDWVLNNHHRNCQEMPALVPVTPIPSTQVVPSIAMPQLSNGVQNNLPAANNSRVPRLPVHNQHNNTLGAEQQNHQSRNQNIAQAGPSQNQNRHASGIPTNTHNNQSQSVSSNNRDQALSAAPKNQNQASMEPKTTQNPMPAGQSKGFKHILKAAPIASGTKVVITNARLTKLNVLKVYVRPASVIQEFIELVQQVEAYANTSKQPASIGRNDIVAALFDEKYYRATILNVNDDGSATVAFPDFGNTSTVSPNEIRALNDDLKMRTRHTIGVTLQTKPGFVPTQSTVEYLEELYVEDEQELELVYEGQYNLMETISKLYLVETGECINDFL